MNLFSTAQSYTFSNITESNVITSTHSLYSSIAKNQIIKIKITSVVYNIIKHTIS